MLIYWRVNSASLPLFALPNRRSLRFTTASFSSCTQTFLHQRVIPDWRLLYRGGRGCFKGTGSGSKPALWDDVQVQVPMRLDERCQEQHLILDIDLG